MYNIIIKEAYKKISYEIINDTVLVTVEMAPFERVCQPVRMSCKKSEIFQWLKDNNVEVGEMTYGHNLNNINKRLCTGRFEFNIPEKETIVEKPLDKPKKDVILYNEQEQVENTVDNSKKSKRKSNKSSKSKKKTHKLLRNKNMV
tara:strand:- start:5574 stop:6008 length:435 start_codon:yes stop_codon:yes gene_type:complete